MALFHVLRNRYLSKMQMIDIARDNPMNQDIGEKLKFLFSSLTFLGRTSYGRSARACGGPTHACQKTVR